MAERLKRANIEENPEKLKCEQRQHSFTCTQRVVVLLYYVAYEHC